ncbi:pentapeptide repeat-containing protein [Pseudanabaena yagii]|uniref:Pentapeptide repeat-containing protein n=1 Tax=Pseudanabaena yagii GIHE-NHR1 TaxID=2722753 RepID=A0ABX1LSL9_9CYAN|nr:pentapeptide repeat-containing protein [Pseudanabaena yagii]NMF58491.1 hypothetical protein [Pseudanabaena yagii GIHE-NHR1]
MASNRNIPQKGQGANEPDKKQPNQQSASADAANVDWMIMSDLSTRIGGSSQAKQEQQAQNTSSNSAPKSASNQSLDDDLADLEWLRSLGLDEPIERSSDQKNTTSGRQTSSQNSNPVTDIDWLIVSDFKTRMDSSEEDFVDSLDQNTPVSNIVPQSSTSTDSLDSIIDDDLGLDSLEFMGDADFSELDSLDAFGFDNADSITGNELQDEIDITEGKILELSNLFDDNPSSDDVIGDDWDGILEESESAYSNQPTPSSLDIIEDNFEIPTQITGVASNEDIDENLGLFADQLSDSISQEDIVAETFNHDLALADLEEDNLQEVDLFTDSNVESFDHNLELADNSLDDQFIESITSNGFEDFLEDPQNPLIDEEINGLVENVADPLDDGFGEMQISESSDLQGIDNDEFWGDVPNLDAESSNASNISSNEVDVDNVFASDWEQSDVSSGDALDDAIWDSSANIASEDLSATSIDNAFGTFDDLAIAPSAESFAIADFAGEISDTDNAENVVINDDLAWSDELEAEISGGISNDDWNLDAAVEAVDTFSDSDFAAAEALIGDDVDHDAGSDVVNDAVSDVIDDVISDNIASDVIDDDLAWSADLEAEIANDIAWNEHNALSEESLEALASEQEHDFADVADNNLAEAFTEDGLNDDFDFGESLEDDFAIANDSNYLIDNSPIDDVIDEVALGNFESVQDEQAYADVDNFEQDLEQYQFNELEEIEQQSSFSSNQPTPDFQAGSSTEESLDPDAEWEKFSEAFAGQITDSNFDDDFSSYVVKPVEAKNVSEQPSISAPEESIGEFQDLDSMIDENFDLAAFDEDVFPEMPPANVSTGISTTLTPNRPVSVPPPPDTSKIEVSPLSVSTNSVPPNLISDPFEEALSNELLNNDYDLAVDLREEALANDLLNGYTSDESAIDKLTSNRPNLSTSPQNLSSPDNFDMESSDRDFLDDFDLDSIDTQLTGDDFDSGFAPAAISTGLTPPPPPPSPPITPVPSISTNQDITFPSVSNPPTPPPPPFLPPLPPKRNPAQAKPAPPSPSVPNAGYQRPSDQSRDRKPVSPIDEGWSELLDADTVLSGVLRSPTGSPYSEPSTSNPPRSGISAGSSVGQSSQSRDRNASNLPKRKDTGLPDFNDLGLEIHDDNTDWSGLLDSGDLSDSITSISGAQLPSRGRTPPLASPRSEMTGISETREIPRDRRKPVASFDATQARMAATPDQVDFNRFTEDNYAAYGYEPPSAPQPASPKQQTKLKIPSVSLESLWQDYLKIPAIGLGAIGGVFLLYTVFNRPIFDIGLRWGIFKDASGKDFTNADFKGAKLDNVDFSKATLTGAKMQDASLVGANFQEANLDGVNFSKANLNRARLIKASVIWAEFNNAQMNLVDLAGADLTRSNFASAKMEGANLKDSKIGAQGTEKATRFPATVLLAWQIVNEPREGRNLASQDLSGLNLSFASLKRANLSSAKLNYTDLTGTDLRGANLTGSQINGANLSGAKLTGINLTDVAFDPTKLPKTDEETICPNNQKGPCKF